MFGDRPELEKGDSVSCVCTACGDRYRHIERTEQDPPRSTMRCPDCHARYQEVKDKDMAAGTWTCRNEELRQAVIDTCEEMGVGTWVEERTDTIHFYHEDE